MLECGKSIKRKVSSKDTEMMQEIKVILPEVMKDIDPSDQLIRSFIELKAFKDQYVS